MRFLPLLPALATVHAVTVYNDLDPTNTATADGAVYTGPPSADPLKLDVPAPDFNNFNPNPEIYLENNMQGLGQPVRGDFLGFSIELSVYEQLFGKNSTLLRPEFLNYLGILQERAGSITIRVGGNSQDRARIETELPGGGIMEKYKAANTGPTDTPTVHFTRDVLIGMKAVADLLNIRYFFGIPFLETNFDGNAGSVVTQVREILGDKLIGLQLANEPDLYGAHLKKDASYDQNNFFDDTRSMIQSLPINDQILMGPSVCCNWGTNDMLDLGYMDMFNANLKYISALHYVISNCDGKTSADYLHLYTTHETANQYVRPYVQPVARARAAGKEFVLLESNTASCGGFVGISDAFISAVWGVDMALKMAATSFSHLLWHVGGQNVYYNPFTPPPTNQTSFKKWTTGPIFYTNVVVAEALGRTGSAQVVDLNVNDGNERTPGYAIYENGVPVRVALINFNSDPSGAADITVNIHAPQNPAQVFVKYLSSASITEKWNVTWANMTLGGQFESDGRFHGDLEIVSVACTAGSCPVPVKAPQVALVFLSQQALSESTPAEGETLTFATSTGRQLNIDYESVAVSNGRNGQVPLGSSSFGSANGSTSRRSAIPTITGIFTFCAILLAYLHGR